MTQLIGARELAKKLNVSLRKLEQMIQQGEIPPFIKIGRIRKWDSNQVELWISQQFEIGNARQNSAKAGQH